MKNKKGDVSDGIIVLVVVFFLAISFVVVAFINDKFSDVITNSPLNNTSVSSNIVSSLDRLTTTGIQRAFVFIFAFLIVGMMISSYLVRVHPAWIFLYILFTGLAIFLAVILANVYSTFINTGAISAIAGQQTMITWIMRNIVKIIIGALALSMIILFAKVPSGGEPI